MTTFTDIVYFLHRLQDPTSGSPLNLEMALFPAHDNSSLSFLRVTLAPKKTMGDRVSGLTSSRMFRGLL